MALGSAFQIGRSGLTAAQAGITVAGNNVSNAATPGYSRQVVNLAPAQDQRFGNAFIGRGVEIGGVRRQVDDALQARLWQGISAQTSAQTDLDRLATVEATLNELGNTDLSSELGRFFSGWSELANSPGQAGTRSLVVERGSSLASYLRSLRSGLTQQQTQIDRDLAANAQRADGLLQELADLNVAIVTAENGVGSAGALRDQRDAVITELSGLFEVTAIEQPDGRVDLLIGSTPVVLAGQSRGVELLQENVDGQVRVRLVTTGDPRETLPVTSGTIGALFRQRDNLVDDTLASLDEVAAQLIFEVNQLHSAGYGTAGLTRLTGTLGLGATDLSLALNDPANATLAELPFAPRSGSFFFTVTNAATGSSVTRSIGVDLDGITAAGAQGFADDTSLEDLRAALAAVDPNVSVTINGSGQLEFTAASGYQFGFSEDTSGVLATLGVNTYFTGTDASDIAVRADLATQPGLLAAGRVVGGTGVDNGAALAIANLRSAPLAALGGVSILSRWDQAVQNVAVRTSGAKTQAEATTIVKDNLEAQRAAVSGVSVDEEAINLLTFQRQYEASARFISVVDQVTQTLLGLIG